jgi:hypothetical protein
VKKILACPQLLFSAPLCRLVVDILEPLINRVRLKQVVHSVVAKQSIRDLLRQYLT